MTGAEQPRGPRPATEEQRRRRRERTFGDLLPDRTTDETGDDAPTSESARDDWLREQVPPHHG